MVERRYMVGQTPPPSAAKRFAGQRAIPWAIDAAAAIEAGLDRAATAARDRPLTALGVALGLGWLAGLRVGRAPH